MQKKANMFANTILTILVLAVVYSISAYGLHWFPFDQVSQTTTQQQTMIVPSQQGDLGSLKVKAISVSGDSTLQFAGTGYAWDQTKPKELIETLNGKTLSATAGTSFAPAYRGHSYEATSFSSSHFCEHAKGAMADEGLELAISCKNLTGVDEVKATFYEDDTAETTNSVGLGAGATKSYNKFLFAVNVSDNAFPLRAMCFGSNTSDTHVKSITMKNWNKDTIPDSLGTGADDYCFSKPDATVFDEWDQKVFNDAIVFEADSTGTGSTEELITVTFLDECEYVTSTNDIKSDYFKRETTGEEDCGATNPTAEITLT